MSVAARVTDSSLIAVSNGKAGTWRRNFRGFRLNVRFPLRIQSIAVIQTADNQRFWRAACGHAGSLPIHDHKRRIDVAPAYAAPQTRRRQAAFVARDPNFIQRSHSAGAQRPLSPREVVRRAENSKVRLSAVGQLRQQKTPPWRGFQTKLHSCISTRDPPQPGFRLPYVRHRRLR